MTDQKNQGNQRNQRNQRNQETDPGLQGNERIEAAIAGLQQEASPGASGAHPDSNTSENAGRRSVHHCGGTAERG